MTLSAPTRRRIATPRRSRRASGAQYLPMLLLAALSATAIFGVVHGPVRAVVLDTAPATAAWLLWLLSIAHLGIGLAVFWRVGGRLITPIGVYFLSHAVFLGYGGLAPASSRASVHYLAYASLTLLVFNVIVLTVALRWLAASGSRPTATPRAEGEDRASDGRSRGPLRIAPYVAVWTALTLGSGVVRSVPIVGGFADVILVGISLLLLQAIVRYRGRRDASFAVVGLPAVLLLTAGAFFSTYYTGYARIIAGAFVVAAASLVARRYPVLPMKALLVAGLLPGLVFTGSGDRTGLTFREVAGGIGEARGVSSATGAVPVFAMTLAEIDTVGLDAFAHRSGRTFLVSALHWVPREWWQGKPNSVEIEHAKLLYPEIAFGYSIVGSNAVEWVLNFDGPGLIPGALLTGAFLAVIERWTREPPRRRRPLPHDLALRALVTGNLTIYAWAGSFSFAARTFTPFLVIVGLRWLAGLGRRRTAGPAPAFGR